MTRNAHILAVLFAAAGVLQPCFAGEPAPGTSDAALFTAERYIEHVKFLASDELEGRRPGTPGIEQAATYISYQFMSFGLKPGGLNNTYYQPFELKNAKRLRPAESSLHISGLEGDWTLGKDWTALPFSAVGELEGPLAFAGFGIEYKPESTPADSGAASSDSSPADAKAASAPATPAEQPYDDFGGFDVRGKVLLVFRAEPRAADPNAKFGGKEPSSRSLFVSKANRAAEKGAKALIFVNPPQRDADGDGTNDADQLYAWNDGETRNTYRVPMIQISQPLAEALLAKAGMPNLTTLQSKLEKERQPLAADMKDISVKIDPGVRYVEVRNVLGVLEGSERPDEYIVIGGHFDHLGKTTQMFGAKDQPAKIHNGADDNASGTSGVIELARVLAAGPRPKRSILFMTFTAEEMGLIGSDHFVNHPTIPLERIKAMINLDMIGRVGQNELEIYGVPTAVEFADLVENHLKQQSIEYKATKSNDRYFGASDHFSFFSKGIPVLFAFTGTHPQYHQPEDDWERIDAPGAARLLTAFHGIATRIANMDSGPTKPSTEIDDSKRAKNAAEKADEASGKLARDQQSGDSAAGSRESNMPRVRMRISIDYSDNGSGVLVKMVMPDGPAEKAGMKDGDRILKLAGKDVADVSAYMSAMKDLNFGDEIEIVVQRKSEMHTLKVKFVMPPEEKKKS